jgi:fucose permease
MAALWRFLTSGVFTRGALYLMCILMVFDYLCSSNIMAWTPRLFEQFYGAQKVLGGSALSASSAGVLVGRLIMGCLPPGRIPDRVLLAVCYVSGVLSFGLIILLQPSYTGSMVLMFLSGAFIAAQAPTMGSLAVAKFGERAPVVIPLYEAVGTVAGIVGPPIVGALADRSGELAPVLWLVPIGGLALGTVAISWELYDRRQTA